MFSSLDEETSQAACLERGSVSNFCTLSSLLLLENKNASNIELSELKGDSSEESGIALMKDPFRRMLFTGVC